MRSAHQVALVRFSKINKPINVLFFLSAFVFALDWLLFNITDGIREFMAIGI